MTTVTAPSSLETMAGILAGVAFKLNQTPITEIRDGALDLAPLIDAADAVRQNLITQTSVADKRVAGLLGGAILAMRRLKSSAERDLHVAHGLKGRIAERLTDHADTISE